jgi:hypothetical protein
MMLVQQALTTQSCIGNRLEPGIGLSHKPVVASATAGTSVTDRLRALADCGVTTVTRSAFGSRDEQTATRAVLVSVLD